MTTALIGLGSNLGDRKATLDFAVQRLRETNGIQQVLASSYHETKSIGGPASQPPFLNAAARVESSLTAEALFHEMQRIEQEAGRIRETHWGPRTLDLDILLFGDVRITTEQLTVPHRLFAFRRFALEPACKVAPEMAHPILHWSVARLTRHVIEAKDAFEIWSVSDHFANTFQVKICENLPNIPIALHAWESVSLIAADHQPPPKARFIIEPSYSSARLEDESVMFVELLMYLEELPVVPTLYCSANHLTRAIDEIKSAIQSMR